MSKMTHLASNDTLEGLFQVREDVTYSTATGVDLTMTVVHPWATDYAAVKPSLPLVVFVQGSGWITPARGFQLPQLCELARRGYVVASVGHRNCVTDGAPSPAYLLDVKCAIRYLRLHAAEFGIDPARVAIWGSSSGSHIAQMVGVTGDFEEFETTENAGASDAVSAVVGCFGPSNLATWWAYNEPNHDFDPIRGKLLAGSDAEATAVAEKLSAINYVSAERAAELPAFFLGVGTADDYVEVTQITNMVEALDAAGAEVEGVLVDGAIHEASFWSQAVLDRIWNFLDRQLRDE